MNPIWDHCVKFAFLEIAEAARLSQRSWKRIRHSSGGSLVGECPITCGFRPGYVPSPYKFVWVVFYFTILLYGSVLFGEKSRTYCNNKNMVCCARSTCVTWFEWSNGATKLPMTTFVQCTSLATIFGSTELKQSKRLKMVGLWQTLVNLYLVSFGFPARVLPTILFKKRAN